MISLIWDRRAYPCIGNFYKRNSDFEEQTAAISKVLPLLKSIKQSYWGGTGNSVKLGNWLTQKQVYFCVRLKQNEFVQLEDEIWLQLKALGLIPGTALYLNGVSVTKQQGFTLVQCGM